jgi:3-oxoacyl-[acyl-carrier protein] reductase
MKARRSGKIINVSSRWALAGNECASDYIAAKSAMLGLTKAWAKELAPWNIQVNAIAPGGVWSQMALTEKGGADGIREAEKKVPLGRWAQPEEIAHLVTFLASPRSDFITGQVVSPNGGASIIGF